MGQAITDGSGHPILEFIGSPIVTGNGRFERPVIIVQHEVLFRGPQQAKRGYSYKTLQCRLSPFDGVYISESLPVKLYKILSKDVPPYKEHINIEIPISRESIASIERMRKSANVRLRLDVELIYEELVEIGTIEEYGSKLPVWGISCLQRSAANLYIEIERSAWVDRVLPALEFNKIHLIEIPAIPLESVAAFQKAFDALKEAQEYHKQGFYNAAVMNCRQALEKIMTGKKTIKRSDGNEIEVPSLDARWKKKLGESTFNWLDEALASLKTVGNDAAHRNRNNFDQFESQMIQAIVVTLLAYVAREEIK